MFNTGEKVNFWSTSHPRFVPAFLHDTAYDHVFELPVAARPTDDPYRPEAVAEIIELDKRRRARAPMSASDLQAWLNDWILNYVHGDPSHATDDEKARKPLAAAEVVVEDVEGNPGYYSAKFFLRPHYQLEGLTVSLRLVSKLPSEKS